MKKNILLFLLNKETEAIINLGLMSKILTVISTLIISLFLFTSLQVMLYFLGENRLDNMFLFAISCLTIVLTFATSIFSIHFFIAKVLLNKSFSFKMLKIDFFKTFGNDKKIILPFILLYTKYAIINFSTFIKSSDSDRLNEDGFIIYLMNGFSNKNLKSMNDENNMFAFYYFFTELIVGNRKYKTNEEMSVVLDCIKSNYLFPTPQYNESYKDKHIEIINQYKLVLIQSKISNFE
jgi:hypothetical protein